MTNGTFESIDHPRGSVLPVGSQDRRENSERQNCKRHAPEYSRQVPTEEAAETVGRFSYQNKRVVHKIGLSGGVTAYVNRLLLLHSFLIDLSVQICQSEIRPEGCEEESDSDCQYTEYRYDRKDNPHD